MSEAQETIEVRQTLNSHWFSSYGVYLKQKDLLREGFPLPSGWFMLTLTIDQTIFPDPKTAYDYLTDHPNSGKNSRLARCMKKINKILLDAGYYEDSSHFCYWRKLEFQKNGWPHWHIFFNLTDRVDKDTFKKLRKVWSFGRLRYDHLDRNGSYAFKYVFKNPFQKYQLGDDCNFESFESTLDTLLPEWFGNDYSFDADKPRTYSGVRFFQTSRNFKECHAKWLESKGLKSFRKIEPNLPNSDLEEPKKPQTCVQPVTANEMLDRRYRKATLIARDENGCYISSKTILLDTHFVQLEREILNPQAFMQQSVQMQPKQHTISRIPERYVHKTEIHKLKHICQKNQLTIPRARQLQRLLIHSSNSCQRLTLASLSKALSRHAAPSRIGTTIQEVSAETSSAPLRH